MALHEDEENTNADIIQDVMEEVEVTAEEENIPVSVNLNESLEVDEEESDMEVEVNSNMSAVEQDEEEKQKQSESLKESLIKPVLAKTVPTKCSGEIYFKITRSVEQALCSEQKDRRYSKTNRKKNGTNR